MFNINPYIVTGALLIYFTLIISALYTIISEKRDPVKAVSWIVVVVTLPLIGFFCYITFGQNYRKRKIFNRKVTSDIKYFNNIIKRQLYKVNSPFLNKRKEVDSNRDIITLLLNNSKSPLTYDNNVSILNNGKMAFPEIIESLQNAKKYIHLEYYMFIDDRTGDEIVDILCEKAKSGVAVRLIYDDVGSWGLTKKTIIKLRKSGVEVESFMPVLFPLLTSKINYRNHRKIIIIDGTVGFTGGMNIADKYIYGNRKLGPWHDVHLKIEGRAVLTLQVVFITDWYFVTGKELRDTKYLSSIHQEEGKTTMQIVTSGPDSPWASIMQAFFMAISCAKKHIYIASPYFSPSESILTAIKVASLSGIEINIMIPIKPDSRIVYWATRSYITELLEAGVNIFMYRGGFNHSKIITIDSEFSAVGSANMDIRSFEDNFEITAFIYDNEKTKELEDIFIEDLKYAKKITLENWYQRSKKDKTKEAICRIVSPLL